jgi:20S proteasome alpha/beta subunit
MLYEWQAYAIGQGAILANKIFEQKWRPGISLRDAVNLAMDVILKSEKKKHGKIVDIAVVRDGKFQKLSDEDLKKI